MTHPKTGFRRITRRRFLTGAAMASGTIAVPWILPSHVWAAQGNAAPSGRINVGLIGHGCMGSGHLRRLAGDPEIQVLAVCDVDRTRREEGKRRVEETYAARSSAGSYQGCTAYNDYREVLARPDIDAVVIVTPDHWHAMQSIHAVEAGKDVYCEKPISMTIREGRRLVEAVRRYGRIFQTGTQYRSISTIRASCRIRAGRRTRQGQVGLHAVGQGRRPPRRRLVHSAGFRPACRAGAGGAGLGSLGRVRPRGSPTTASTTGIRCPAWCPGRSRGFRRGRDHVVSLARRRRHSVRAGHGEQRPGRDHPPERGTLSDAHLPIRQWHAPASGRSLGHGQGRVQSGPRRRTAGRATSAASSSANRAGSPR